MANTNAYATREKLKTAYDNTTWRNKVAKMSDAQAQAIYLRMKKEGRI